MGYKKPVDYQSISQQLYRLGSDINNPRLDGFIQFELKRDLYRIKHLVDTILQESPRFEGEDLFLRELEKEKIFNILKK